MRVVVDHCHLRISPPEHFAQVQHVNFLSDHCGRRMARVVKGEPLQLRTFAVFSEKGIKGRRGEAEHQLLVPALHPCQDGASPRRQRNIARPVAFRTG